MKYEEIHIIRVLLGSTKKKVRMPNARSAVARTENAAEMHARL
jgi:hypothetical protein